MSRERSRSPGSGEGFVQAGPAPLDASRWPELRKADAAARSLAQRDFETPLVLEAGAGTGKTATLVARVVGWALGPGWERAEARRASAIAPALSARPLGEAADEESDEISAAREREALAGDLLSRVVAITFTEAAAAEMGERVEAALRRIAAGERPAGVEEGALPADRDEREARSLALLAQIDRFGVRTIHGFCRRLLAQWPLEAGLAPGFAVDADGSLLAECAREAVEAAFRAIEAGGENDAPTGVAAGLATLAVAGFGPAEVEQALVEAAGEGVRPTAFDGDPFAPERLEAFVHGLRRAHDAYLEAGGEALVGVTSSTLCVAAAEAIASIGDAADPPAPRSRETRSQRLDAVAEWLAVLAEPFGDDELRRISKWASGEFTDGERAALPEAADALAEFVAAAGELRVALRLLGRADPHHSEAVRVALGPLLVAVEAEMGRRGATGFGGLLEAARSLLELPTVARRARESIDQLLVDEFQDTDGTQCEIVASLAGFGRPSDEFRPGLFLVGDPKQSIYGWRGADLSAYQGFVERVLAEGGECHALRVNFRSVPAILDEVERVVGACMQPEAGVQPGFEALVPSEARAESPGFVGASGGESGTQAGSAQPAGVGWAPVEHWVAWGADRDDDGLRADPKIAGGPAAALEARAVAADLARLHEECGVAWSSAAILLRSMTQLEPLLDALRESGIPHAVTREKDFYRKREVADAALAVRVVLDPWDHLALVGWLRSPGIGVPDAALAPLLAAGLAERVAVLGDPASDDAALGELAGTLADVQSTLPKELPGATGGELAPGWTLRARAGLESLAALRRSQRDEAPDRFLGRLRRLFANEAIEAARYLGSHRSANLERFFRELQARLVDERDPAAIVRWLRTRRDEAARSPLDEAVHEEDAVRIMTIHGAKGLDFDHVYLMQTHRRRAVRSGGAGMRVGSVVPAGLAISDLGSGETSAESVEFAEFIEFDLLGGCTLGAGELERRAERRERAEDVRTLYVALTRARDRLVVSGTWPARETGSTAAGLVAARGPSPDDLERAMRSLAEAQSEFDAKPDPPAVFARESRSGNAAVPRRGAGPGVDLAGARFVFPALEDLRLSVAGGSAPSNTNPSESESAAAAASEAPELHRERRRAAALRMQRPLAGRVTGSADETQAPALQAAPSDRATRSEERAAESRPIGRSGEAQRVALASGTLVHALLESLELAGDARELAAALRGDLERRLALSNTDPDADAIGRRCGEIVDAIEAGPFLERLAEIGPDVVARELPVLVAPGSDRAELGHTSGAIDLVYRDAEAGDQWVVVDYKSDRVAREDAAGLGERAKAHAEQARAYGDALQRALGLSERPRLELWFLEAGACVVV